MSFSFSGGFKAPTTTGSTMGTGFNFAATSSAGAVAQTSTPSLSSSGFSFAKPTASSTGTGFTFAAAPPAPATAPAPALAGTTTAAAGGINFNFNPPASTTATATGFPVLATTSTGATPSSFAFPAAKTLAAPTPAPPTAQGTPSIPATTSSVGGLATLFATPASQAQAPASQPGLLGQPVAKAPTLTASLPSTSSGEGLFSTVTASSAPSLTPASTTLLGIAPATTTTPLAATPAASTPLATLTTATSTSASTASSTAAVTTPTLSVHGLEDKVNKWLGEITEQQERLMRQAAHVNAWDQLLQLGHDQVQQLRDTLNKVKMNQQSLEAELDFIQGQQQELEQLIEPLEATVASTTPAQHQGDRQRDNMHHLAQNLDAQLHQMTDDLCKVIEHLNSNNSGSQATDPVNTVARVLSAHMDTLKWVDQNSALLTQKIEDLSKLADSKRRV